jgi:hypothetical protein
LIVWTVRRHATARPFIREEAPVGPSTIPDSAYNAFVEIFKAAITSPLGVLAMFGIAVLLVAAWWLRQAPWPAKVGVLILLLASVGLFGWTWYTIEVSKASPALVADATTSQPPQPTPPSEKPPTVPGPPSAAAPTPPAAPVRVDCGTVWTGWVKPAGGVGDPCPSGCVRGAELGQSYRMVGFPPKPQTKHKFQCWRQ